MLIEENIIVGLDTRSGRKIYICEQNGALPQSLSKANLASVWTSFTRQRKVQTCHHLNMIAVSQNPGEQVKNFRTITNCSAFGSRMDENLGRMNRQTVRKRRDKTDRVSSIEWRLFK
jgi:hypothetical protein